MNEVHSWQFDRTAALGRLDDDAELLMDVIQQFVADAPASLAAIQTAIREADGRALVNAAHALKGAAGYLAADQLCVAAQELEGFGRANRLDHAHEAWPAFSGIANTVIDALRTEVIDRH